MFPTPPELHLGNDRCGYVPQPVLIFAEVLGGAVDRCDVMDLACMVMPLEQRALKSVASNSRAVARPADEPDGRRRGPAPG